MFGSKPREDVERRVVEAIREAAPERQDTSAVYERVMRDASVAMAVRPPRSKQAREGRRPRFVALFQLTATLAFVAGLAVLAMVVPVQPPVKKPPKLPVVGSFNNLKRLLEKTGDNDVASPDFITFGAVPSSGSGKRLSARPGQYSQTNIQVQGVDEADIVKTDGRYIYQIVDGEVRVVRARPVGEMAVVATFRHGGFTPFELYVDDRYLVVLGTVAGERKENSYLPTGTVRADIYEKNDQTPPQKVREIEVEGEYVSSRMVGSSLYVVTNKYLDRAMIMKKRLDPGNITPGYSDSAGGGRFERVKYSDISYFPDGSESNYLVVAGTDLSDDTKKVTVRTFLGAAQNVYSSIDSLYVAATSNEAGPGSDWIPGSRPPARTDLYKFSLFQGDITYAAKGQVPGTVLNQYSMDEYNGHFRLATTSGEVWGRGTSASKNNIYTLDSRLKTVGRLENLAEGERIYSARFMGDRAYMVTFKQVDPLFVIDLKDPRRPAVLGELKIPGYSDYLHPYDENHIIGFGKDTAEAEGGGFAWNQGLKIAMFDVSDVSHPVEKFKTVIGRRGSDSELLQNAKALLIDTKRGFMAFPVTVMDVPVEQSRGLSRFPASGKSTFQGAYVYDIGVETGLALRGRISHMTKEGDARPGQVRRVVYIGDVLYAVSDGKVTAHELKTLRELGSTGPVGN